MELNFYQIDTFTNTIFGGNPACVVYLKHWLDDEILLNIANENAVAETAFFVKQNNSFHLRWFTPEIEMDLCGHATLATAYVLKKILKYPEDEIIFETASGKLTVTNNGDLFTLDFPSRKPVQANLPEILKKSLNIQPTHILKARDYILVYNTEEEIKNIQINRQIFDQINLDPGGIVVTAKGNNCDFVSRFFTPQASILEDPVTGSAHCSLIPYWSKQLNKKSMKAYQISKRKGTLYCTYNGNRVLISGNAKIYAIGTFWLK